MRFVRLFLLVMAAAAASQAQTWDTRGNSMLKGTYYFRQVIYLIGYSSGQLIEAVSVYGNINFDGNGNYTITAADQTAAADYSYYYGTWEYQGPYPATGAATVSGTYSIGSSGYGFIASPYIKNDLVYGLVSAQGIFVGSSTENQNGYNDMMIAAPEASPQPTASSFTGSWTCADFDLSGGSPASALSLTFPLSPNGVNSLGSVTVTGYYGSDGATLLTPSQVSNVSYTFSNGAAVAAFPSNGAYVSGSKYLYFSPDGNFLFGGSPDTSNTPFDMIVGVKTGASPTYATTYYQAGIDALYNPSAGAGDIDTWYGSVYTAPGATPPCAEPLAAACMSLLGHQRLNDFGGAKSLTGYGSLYDYTYSDSISPTSAGVASNGYAHYIAGDGGTVIIGSGIGPYLGVRVAVAAPTLSNLSATGVVLDPTRVENSASAAPFTAGIAPGELLTLYGTNLAAVKQMAPVTNKSGTPIPLPTTLDNVQVSIGGLPAPIYYVSPTQLSAIVPYGVTGPTAQIQVTNGTTPSNTVWEYVNATSPGVFTENENGTGYGLIEHLGIGNSAVPAGTVVSDANPALEGETLAVYLTGLGAVSPTIVDGGTGGGPCPGATCNVASASFSVYFGADATAVTPTFAGLAPGYDGLYQLNVMVPASGLTAGPTNVSIVGPDSEMSYVLIPISLSSSAAVTPVTNAAVKAPAARVTPRQHQAIKAAPRLPGGK